MNSKITGAFIAQLRKERGLTQRELSQVLNISDKTVSKWETGEGYPEITLFPALALALGVTTDELFKGERIPPKTIEVVTTSAPKDVDYLGLSATVLRIVAFLTFVPMGISTVVIFLVPVIVFIPASIFFITFGIFSHLFCKQYEQLAQKSDLLVIANTVHRPVRIFFLLFFWNIIAYFSYQLFGGLDLGTFMLWIYIPLAIILTFVVEGFVFSRLGYVQIREEILKGVRDSWRNDIT